MQRYFSEILFVLLFTSIRFVRTRVHVRVNVHVCGVSAGIGFVVSVQACDHGYLCEAVFKKIHVLKSFAFLFGYVYQSSSLHSLYLLRLLWFLFFPFAIVSSSLYLFFVCFFFKKNPCVD